MLKNFNIGVSCDCFMVILFAYNAYISDSSVFITCIEHVTYSLITDSQYTYIGNSFSIMNCSAVIELTVGEIFKELFLFSFITYYITILKRLFSKSY